MAKTRIADIGNPAFCGGTDDPVLRSSSMQLTDNWRNSTYTGAAYKKIMVVAMTKRADLRQPIEDEFAKQLKVAGH